MSNIKHYHFTYKTTCLINGRYYLGMHSTRKLNDGYLGSGTVLRRSLYKYGKENHKIEILEFFENRDDLTSGEIQLITEKVLNDPLCMNLALGGGNGWTAYNKSSNSSKNKKWNSIHKRFLGKHHSDETKLKISKHSIESGNQRGSRNPMFGKNHSDEVKLKLSQSNIGVLNSQFGTVWITNGTENKKIKKESLIPDGWERGRS